MAHLRIRRPACSCLRLLLFLALSLNASLPAQTLSDDPLGTLRTLTRSAKLGFSSDQALEIALEISRPVSSDSTVVMPLANLLAKEQLAWQSAPKSGINESKCLTAINREFQSAIADNPLKLSELRMMRVYLWTQLPKLNGGIRTGERKSGSYVIEPAMSPFEAYLSVGLLLYQRVFNSAYDGKPGISKLKPDSKPGIRAMPLSDKQIEFRDRFFAIMASKWQTTDAALDSISRIFAESREDGKNE